MSRSTLGHRDVLQRIKALDSPKAEPLLDWEDADLVAPWTAFDATHAPAGFHMGTDGYVHLRGLITGGLVGDVILKLPIGFRPEYPTALLALASGPNVARVEVDTADPNDPTAGGEVTFFSISAPLGSGYLSLDGLRFRAFS